MTILIDGHVIEDVRIELHAVASFANTECRISGLVVQDGVGIKPMFALTKRVTVISIDGRTGRIRDLSCSSQDISVGVPSFVAGLMRMRPEM